MPLKSTMFTVFMAACGWFRPIREFTRIQQPLISHRDEGLVSAGVAHACDVTFTKALGSSSSRIQRKIG